MYMRVQGVYYYLTSKALGRKEIMTFSDEIRDNLISAVNAEEWPADYVSRVINAIRETEIGTDLSAIEFDDETDDNVGIALVAQTYAFFYGNY